MNTLAPQRPLDRDTPATIDAPLNAPLDAPLGRASGGSVFDIDTLLTYQVSGPSDFIFQIHAQEGGDQTVLQESLEVTPNLPFSVYPDALGRVRFTRLHVESGVLEVRYRARVQRHATCIDEDAEEVSIAQLPNGVLPYLMPSRYCESDLLSRAAQKLFCNLPTGRQRVQALCDWIHVNVDYQIGSSDATTTAMDVFTRRVGVCRDFAHLAITLCRALNIPARLVAGYAIFDTPPPDFHAVFEAYIGGQWQLFDATRMSPVNDLLRISWGHDARDVAFATIFGPAVMTSMQPNVQRLDPA